VLKARRKGGVNCSIEQVCAHPRHAAHYCTHIILWLQYSPGSPHWVRPPAIVFPKAFERHIFWVNVLDSVRPHIVWGSWYIYAVRGHFIFLVPTPSVGSRISVMGRIKNL
jgi:hypothetical protein